MNNFNMIFHLYSYTYNASKRWQSQSLLVIGQKVEGSTHFRLHSGKSVRTFCYSRGNNYKLRKKKKKCSKSKQPLKLITHNVPALNRTKEMSGFKTVRWRNEKWALVTHAQQQGLNWWAKKFRLFIAKDTIGA